MVIDRDLLLPPDVVQIEQVMYGAEDARVSQAVTREEGLEIRILLVRHVIVVELRHIEVLLCKVELVIVVVQVPLWEFLSQPQFAALERLVVAQR